MDPAVMLAIFLRTIISPAGLIAAGVFFSIPSFRYRIAAAILVGVVAGALSYRTRLRVAFELELPLPELTHVILDSIAIYMTLALLVSAVVSLGRRLFRKKAH